MRLLTFAIASLLLLTACQRYTIGAENAAPRVIVGETELRRSAGAESSHGETSHEAAEPNAETAQGAENSAESATTEAHSEELPEIVSAKQLVEATFAHVRGSVAARAEAAAQLEATKESLKALYDSGAISHWEELEEAFYVAASKVREGTNDAPNALHRLLVDLDEAAHNE